MAGIYHNATLGLISLSSDGENWITIADKNLGATSTDITSVDSYGYYYQWGNNYGGYKYNDTVTTTNNLVNASAYGPGNYYSNSTFVLSSSQVYDPVNTNLRGGDTGTVEAMRGPCPEGYHIPSGDDFSALYDLGVTMSARGEGQGSTLKQLLLIPTGDAWDYLGDGSWMTYNRVRLWGSNVRPNGTQYYTFYIEGENIYQSWGRYPETAMPIRPFKNEPEIPDYNDVWDTLYGDELPDRPEPPVPVKKLKWLVNKGNYYYFKDAPTHASSVTLNESSITLTEAGQTYQLTATVAPDDAVIKKVHWSSSDITVATVTQTGLVTCVTPGECTITATCDGVSGTCSVEDIKEAYVAYIVVGGGGGGGSMMHSGYDCIGGGGGGGGDVCAGCITLVGSTSITIGAGGAAGCNGGDTTFGDIIAKGGCAGITNYSACPSCKSGGNSGKGCVGGNLSGSVQYASSGGGGGGAGGVGGSGTATRCSNWGCWQGGNGGLGKCGYGGGGGGGMPVSTTDTTSYGGKGCCGGGDGGTYNNRNSNGCPATKYGGGGGGGGCYNSQGVGGAGCKGVVFVCYLTSCGYDVTGGCKYTSGDYTVHRFTSNGTLTVN